MATRLAGEIEGLGPFKLLTRGDELPVFAFTLAPEIENFTAFDLSNALRARGWQVPAYTFPANRTDLAALRVVVRRGFTHDLADLLARRHQARCSRVLEKQPAPVHTSENARASTTDMAATGSYGEGTTWQPATPRLGLLRTLVSWAVGAAAVWIAAAIVPGSGSSRPARRSSWRRSSP